MSHYIKHIMLVDMITISTMTLSLAYNQVLYDLTFFLRLVRLMDLIAKTVNDNLRLDTNAEAFFRLVKLLLILLYLVHIIACAQYLQARIQMEQGQHTTWINAHGMMDQPW